MANVVQLALLEAEAKGLAKTDSIWHVTFVGNETRSGSLVALNNNVYRLEGSKDYYFSADQVVFLYLKQ